MDYTYNSNNQQSPSETTDEYLRIPSTLTNFINTDTTRELTKSDKPVNCFKGYLKEEPYAPTCSCCGQKMHVNHHLETSIRHIPFGQSYNVVRCKKIQYRCPKCNKTHSQDIPFQAPNHLITKELLTYIESLLAKGTYTNKDIAELAGVGQNVVKDIDKRRLERLYKDGDGNFIKPSQPARFLGIDEFKLHDGYQFATHIINLETGEVLWVAKGKKKQVVYDFINHVGMEWMDNVEAISCDMNSDFEEAFEEMCPHIQPVFDYFHIKKNFNDKVISNVRKDEQKRLLAEGKLDEVASLKGSKLILTSSRETLKAKDKEKNPNIKDNEKGEYELKYENLIKENLLLFKADIIKEKLGVAFSRTDEIEMTRDISEIMSLCKDSGNKHFKWFGRLLDRHFKGIVAHATYKISNGKIEGINNKIKTLRRSAYGYLDDDYFFLKIFDISRAKYVHNPKSHNFNE